MPQQPSKGEQTRQRIEQVAGRMFAEKSFGAVSLRAIAREAQVDPALINYYFGSKEGLFSAYLESTLRPAHIAEALGTFPPEERGAELVRYAETLWISPAGQAMIAIVRGVIAGESTMLQKYVSTLLVPRLVELTAGPEEERRLRATLIGSQMAGLLLLRHVVRVPPLSELPADQVIALVGPTVQRYLTGTLDSAARDETVDDEGSGGCRS